MHTVTKEDLRITSIQLDASGWQRIFALPFFPDERGGRFATVGVVCAPETDRFPAYALTCCCIRTHEPLQHVGYVFRDGSVAARDVENPIPEDDTP